MVKNQRKLVREALAPLDLNQRYTLDESCAYLRISRTHLYNKIRAGKLPVIVDGSRKFVAGSIIAAQSRAS